MPCKVLLGCRVAQTACRVLLGYVDVVKPQEVPGGSIYPYPGVLNSFRTPVGSNEFMVAAILKRTVLEKDGPLYDLVTCWGIVKSTAMNLNPLWSYG